MHHSGGLMGALRVAYSEVSHTCLSTASFGSSFPPRRLHVRSKRVSFWGIFSSNLMLGSWQHQSECCLNGSCSVGQSISNWQLILRESWLPLVEVLDYTVSSTLCAWWFCRWLWDGQEFISDSAMGLFYSQCCAERRPAARLLLAGRKRWVQDSDV